LALYSVKIEQPLGWKVESVIEKMHVCKAEEILSTKKQRRYTLAVRRDLQAELTKHIWKCPYCGERIPAYPEYFHNDTRNYEPVKRAMIADWATLQLSLFDDYSNNSIGLNVPLANGERQCPRCGKKSMPSNKVQTITFTTDKHHLIISTEVRELNDIFSLRWLSNSWLNITFPLYETVVFNFKKGTTYLKLHDTSGKIFAISDVTQRPEAWNNGAVYEAITKNRINQRTVKRFFIDFFGSSLPFPNQELSPEKYVLMTRFMRYPRSFYSAIPFVEGSWQIDSSFKKAARCLHCAENVPRFYNKSMLPKAKSIKRIFYEEPGLLFYRAECQLLWEVVQDVNLYRRIIQSDRKYEILSQMHMYPGVIDYYRDYIAVKGAKLFINALEKRLDETNCDAVVYASLNSRAKRAEQERWKNKSKKKAVDPDEDDEDFRMFGLPRSMKYSVPMNTGCNSIKECSIDGYYFTWLYSMNDYIAAGQELKNCLRRWERWQRPVIGIYKGPSVVGAVEVDVDKKRVIQAHTKRNGDIKSDESLNNAFEKWKKRYGLKSFQYF